jgi:hypothetical protein
MDAACEQRVDHEHARAAERIDGRVGHRLRVGDVGERPDAICVHRHRAVRHRHRGDVDVSDAHGDAGREGDRAPCGFEVPGSGRMRSSKM